jgi:hypothetical protein
LGWIGKYKIGIVPFPPKHEFREKEEKKKMSLKTMVSKQGPR